MRPRLIGLTGRKLSGKDTVGRMLSFEYCAHLEAFAKPIKDALAVMFHVEPALFYDQALKEIPDTRLLGHTPRHIMQTLGTEWARVHVAPDMWAQLCMRRIREFRAASQRDVVIVDVRFDNEAEMVIIDGGEVWEINRDKVLGPRDDSHASEKGVKSQLISRVIDNNGDIDALFSQVKAAFG